MEKLTPHAHTNIWRDRPSERVIFPVSKNESRSIEDVRFVQFSNGDGEVVYFVTYTAYNGITILPQLIETKDFIKFNILTLNGKAVQNKYHFKGSTLVGGQSS